MKQFSHIRIRHSHDRVTTDGMMKCALLDFKIFTHKVHLIKKNSCIQIVPSGGTMPHINFFLNVNYFYKTGKRNGDTILTFALLIN